MSIHPELLDILLIMPKLSSAGPPLLLPNDDDDDDTSLLFIRLILRPPFVYLCRSLMLPTMIMLNATVKLNIVSVGNAAYGNNVDMRVAFHFSLSLKSTTIKCCFFSKFSENKK